jgi:hypothetical protein
MGDNTAMTKRLLILLLLTTPVFAQWTPQTNWVQRSVQVWMNTGRFSGSASNVAQTALGVFNVWDFGATGSGTNDDAPAIQAAINAANAGGGSFGGQVVVLKPYSFYLINEPIYIPPTAGTYSNLRIIGQGPGASLIAGTNMNAVIVVTGDDVEIANLQFQNPTGLAANALVLTEQSSDPNPGVNVHDCYFTSFPNGITWSGENFKIKDNTFVSCSTAINCTNDGRNSWIDHNYILGANTGILFKKGTMQVEGTEISDNKDFASAGNGAGISLTDGLEVYIHDNVVDQTGTNGGALIMGATGGTLSRIKVVRNWLVAGANTNYCIFVGGNNSFLTFIDNTLVPADSNATGVALSYTTNFNWIANNFLGYFAHPFQFTNPSRFSAYGDSVVPMTFFGIGDTKGALYEITVNDNTTNSPAWRITWTQ